MPRATCSLGNNQPCFSFSFFFAIAYINALSFNQFFSFLFFFFIFRLMLSIRGFANFSHGFSEQFSEPDIEVSSDPRRVSFVCNKPLLSEISFLFRHLPRIKCQQTFARTGHLLSTHIPLGAFMIPLSLPPLSPNGDRYCQR